MRVLMALRDTKTGSFLAPMTAVNESEAGRIYADLLENGPALIAKHAADFPLYEIGRYDEQTGEVFPLFTQSGSVAPPRLLLDAAAVHVLRREE